MSFAWFKKKPEVNMQGMPSNVVKLTGNKVQGPNCWNATILFFNPEAEVGYTSPEQMVEWLNNNTTEDQYKFCAVGSILALYNEADELIHTAVYVSPGILWHKRGIGGHWEFVTERQLKAIYFEAKRREHRVYSAA